MVLHDPVVEVARRLVPGMGGDCPCPELREWKAATVEIPPYPSHLRSLGATLRVRCSPVAGVHWGSAAHKSRVVVVRRTCCEDCGEGWEKRRLGVYSPNRPFLGNRWQAKGCCVAQKPVSIEFQTDPIRREAKPTCA